MAISTYAELQTTIGSWSHADDLTAQYLGDDDDGAETG